MIQVICYNDDYANFKECISYTIFELFDILFQIRRGQVLAY